MSNVPTVKIPSFLNRSFHNGTMNCIIKLVSVVFLGDFAFYRPAREAKLVLFKYLFLFYMTS